MRIFGNIKENDKMWCFRYGVGFVKWVTSLGFAVDFNGIESCYFKTGEPYYGDFPKYQQLFYYNDKPTVIHKKTGRE